MSNRSGSPYSVPRDANRVPFLVAASTADGITPVVLEADPVTHLLQVSSSGGGGGGTQYQELATTSPATGNLVMGRYQTSLPTLTNGQMNEPMLDSTSTLLVNSSTLGTAANQATMIASLGNISTSANQTNGNQKTQVTDGTNTANVTAASTAATAANKGVVVSVSPNSIVLDKPQDTIVTGTAGALNAAVTATMNGTAMVGIQITGTFNATITFEGTIDGSTWFTLSVSVGGGYSNSFSTTTTGTGQFMALTGGLNGFRARVSTYVSGTATITLQQSLAASFSYLPTPQTPTVNVGNFAIGAFGNGDAVNAGITSSLGMTESFLFNGTTWDRARSATAASNTTGTGLLGSGILGQYNTSPSNITAGNYGVVQIDVVGQQLMSTGGAKTTAIAAGTAANTVIKASAGRIANILVTTVGAGALQVFDNSTTNSGTIIAALPASAALGSSYTFSMPAANGITVGGSATNPAVTISWT